MQWFKEVCDNDTGHVYLVEGNRVLAYRPNGQEPARFFAQSMRFDRRGRKFVPTHGGTFDQTQDHNKHLTEIKGSTGTSYWVDSNAGTCTCPGFQFRGHCKHLSQSRAA